MDPVPDHNNLDITVGNDQGQTFPDRPLKDYLVGPKSNNPVVHGWTRESILFNHLDENVEKVLKKPLTSVAAVIVTRDRPADRPAGADAIADALHELKIADRDDFIVIPPTPKAGDPSAPILPHTNIIICSSPDLKDKVSEDPSKAIVNTTKKDGSDGFTFYLMPAYPDSTSTTWYIGTYVGASSHTTAFEFFSGLFDRLIGDRAIIRMIQEHHDRVPEAQDIPFVVRVILEYAEIKPCQVWMPGKQGRAPERQHAFRLYMPTPSLDAAASKEFKDHLTAPTFSFLIDCRGRATPFQPSRGGRIRAMECSECLALDHYKDDCPITHSPEYLSVHLNDAELEPTKVGTTLASIGRNETSPDGFTTVASRRSRDQGKRGSRGGRFRGRGQARGRSF